MTIKPVEFGEWLPDQPPIGNPGLTVAKNCIPWGKGYKSLNALADYSGAIGGRCFGAFSAIDDDNNVADFAGDATKLYKLSDVTWNDVSGATYTTVEDGNWRFVQFGQKVIATNFADNMQAYQLGVSSTFADLDAAAPRARYITTSRNFVFVGNTYDSVDGNKPAKLIWSALGDETDWTASVTTQSDFQYMAEENGPITGIVGGEFLVVFQDRAITRGDYVGPPAIWNFDEVSTNLGCSVPNSIVQRGQDVYFLSSEDFYVFSASGVRPLGAQRVAKWFYTNFNQTYQHRMSSAVDPINSLIIWSYPSTNSANGTPDSLIIYNWVLDRWSYASLSHEIIYRSLSKGYTLEGLDDISASLDNLALSLDSRAWAGGKLLLSAFTTEDKLAFFTGSALSAQFDTGDFTPRNGSTSNLMRVRPIVDGTSPTVTVQHAAKQTPAEAVSFGSALSPNATTGNTAVRSKGRYHRLRFNVSGGFDFAQGFEAEYKTLGHR